VAGARKMLHLQYYGLNALYIIYYVDNCPCVSDIIAANAQMDLRAISRRVRMGRSIFGRIRTDGKIREAASAHFRRDHMSAGEQRISASATDTHTARIVRYPNRRFYDRSQGRYVTLREIAAMVREGKTVNVRDSRTGDDITSTVLTQIILEHHPDR